VNLNFILRANDLLSVIKRRWRYLKFPVYCQELQP